MVTVLVVDDACGGVVFEGGLLDIGEVISGVCGESAVSDNK